MSNERTSDLVRNLMLNNYIDAKGAFDDIMNEKVFDALENITLGITDTIFNDGMCESCEDDIEEAKMADKDYDGDGKIETGTQEWKGSRDKAIKKAMATRKEEVEELDELKMPKMDAKGRAKNFRVRAAYKSGAERAATTSQNRDIAARHHIAMARGSGKTAEKSKVRAKGMVQALKRSASRMTDRSRKAGMSDSYEPTGDDIQELKSATLRNYVTKARGKVQSDLSTGKHSPATNRRAASVSAALSRLDARSKMKGGDKSPDTKKLARGGSDY